MFLLPVIVAWVVCVPGVALAQDNTSSRISNTETEPYYFVPSLHGALLLEMGIRSRLARDVTDSAKIPELDSVFKLGYRTYFDDWARSLASGYVVGGVSLDGHAVHGRLSTVGLGVQGQLRFMGDQFIGLLMSASVEGGLAVWSAPTGGVTTHDVARDPELASTRSALDDDRVGYRLAVGLETGFGYMMVFDPYIFAEQPIWFGIEHINLEGASWTTVQFGLQVRFDFIHR